MRFLALFLTLLSLPVYAVDTKITLDRSWGLLIGDQITASIELPVAVSDLDAHSLPQHDKRYGHWLYLYDSEMAGQQMQLHFQIINVPAENRQVATPELQLRTKEGEFITVPSVPMQIGSFLGQKDTQDNLNPRGDISLQPQSNEALTLRLWVSFVVLLVAVLIWLIWHFGFRPRERLPFATAMFELNKMRLLGRKDADNASRSLHKAFNRSAGRVVINSHLDKLWDKCPWLAPLEADIESFYQQSAAHFFSPDGAEQKDFYQILELAKACRARERVA
ncbi:hypothetical protein [Methylophaga sp.]|uniref:hypothetical protein n=1 Tax=Methylophaga sp. TaxID=2024840 RepID=UPI003F6A27E8